MNKDVTAIISSCKFGDLSVMEANKLINETFQSDLIIRVVKAESTKLSMQNAIDDCNSHRRFNGDPENKITMEIIFDGTLTPGETIEMIQVNGIRDHKELFALACIYSDYHRDFIKRLAK